eukprot:gene13183-17665_t
MSLLSSARFNGNSMSVTPSYPTIPNLGVNNNNIKMIPVSLQEKNFNVLKIPRGGKTDQVAGSKEKKGNLSRNLSGIWAIFQVISILANAVRRLVPIAIQPIIQKDVLPFHWILYVGWIGFMVYTEGYKAFQLKFSPMVVDRAFNLSSNPSIINYALAGPYSMGLFGAPKKRMIVSWCVTIGVFALVKIVKLLPYPYRSIIDAGVVAGLSYGSISICVLGIKALVGTPKKNDSLST